MIEITVQKPKHGRTIKIYGRNDEDDQPPVTVTIRRDDLHIYSHADMTHEDWLLLSIRVANAITEMKQNQDGTP